MTTAHKQLVDEFKAALSASVAISSQVYDARLHPIAAQHSDALVVRLIDSQIQPKAISGARMLCTTQIAVECYARSATVSTTAAVDALLQAAYARLAADATVNAATRDVLMTGIAWDFDQEAEQFACATMTWAITHQVESNTLT